MFPLKIALIIRENSFFFRLIKFRDHESVVTNCAFDLHERLYATCSWDKTIRLYDITVGCFR